MRHCSPSAYQNTAFCKILSADTPKHTSQQALNTTQCVSLYVLRSFNMSGYNT